MLSELHWHQEVAAALERGVRNRDWFLWLTLDPPSDDKRGSTPPLTELADQVDAWLSGLDPDVVTHTGRSEQWTWTASSGAARLTLSAIPKKPDARGHAGLIGNPVPAFAYWLNG